MFCETFISYLSRTCSNTIDCMTYHGDVEVDEEGFMKMVFEAGNTNPPDYDMGHEWVSEVAIHDMDTHEARQKLNDQKVKAIIEAPP
jgi:hypothetical protein